MKDIISVFTRTAFQETYVKCGILSDINNDFGTAGLVQVDIPEGRVIYGERRSLVERYYSSVNWRSSSDVRKVLKAYEPFLLRLVERQLTYEFDTLIKRLDEDGFRFHKGTIELQKKEESFEQKADLPINSSRQLSMYEYISQIEKTVHKLVQNTLKAEFGVKESGWWRQGIAEDIRKKCKNRYEEDPKPSHSAFNYTDMIDLSKIISKNWGLFQNLLPRNYAANHKELDSDFARLNRIRNDVMHPVKNKKYSKDDIQFVKNVLDGFLNIIPTHPDGGKVKKE